MFNALGQMQRLVIPCREEAKQPILAEKKINAVKKRRKNQVQCQHGADLGLFEKIKTEVDNFLQN